MATVAHRTRTRSTAMTCWRRSRAGVTDCRGGGERAARALRPQPHRPDAPEPASVLLWRRLASPLILVLIASGAVALALGEIADGAVVLAVVVANSAIGFDQEWRAGRAIHALAALVPERATDPRRRARASRRRARRARRHRRAAPGERVARRRAAARLARARGRRGAAHRRVGAGRHIRRPVSPTPSSPTAC